MAIQYRMNRFDVETIEGLSTDAKPPYPKEGATFRETDTGKKWIFTEQEGWIPVQKSGGSGGSVRWVNDDRGLSYFNREGGSILRHLFVRPSRCVTPDTDFVIEFPSATSAPMLDGVPWEGGNIEDVYISNEVDGVTELVTLSYTEGRGGEFTGYGSGHWYSPARLEVKDMTARITSTDPDSSPDAVFQMSRPAMYSLGSLGAAGDGTDTANDMYQLLRNGNTPSNEYDGWGIKTYIGGRQFALLACLQDEPSEASSYTYDNEFIAIANGDGTVTTLSNMGSSPIASVNVTYSDSRDAYEVVFSRTDAGEAIQTTLYALVPAFVVSGEPYRMPWQERGPMPRRP